MEIAIRAQNLSREFTLKEGKKVAVDNVSFEIGKGTIFGLLGPNGAGKSTTIKMLTTILLPTSGLLDVLGHDVYTQETQIRKQIGLLYGGEHGLYWQLSGRDNLRFFGSLFKIKKDLLEERIDYWLDRVGLSKDQDRLINRYSKGMKQRLHIARSMLHDPAVLFMDEPTLGLDPQGTLDLRQIIKELKAAGKTIILTTHDMEEAQELCDEIAFIMDGKIVAQGTYDDLQNRFQDSSLYEVEVMHAPEHLLATFEALPEFAGLTLLENGHALLKFEIAKSADGEAKFRDIVNQLSAFTICQLVRKKMDLRSMYLQLVNASEKMDESSAVSV